MLVNAKVVSRVITELGAIITMLINRYTNVEDVKRTQLPIIVIIPHCRLRMDVLTVTRTVIGPLR